MVAGFNRRGYYYSFYNSFCIVLFKYFGQMVLATEAFGEKSFPQMFVGLRGILKVPCGRSFYWHVYNYINYNIDTINWVLHKTPASYKGYLVPFHYITLESWKGWYYVVYFTVICIRIWIIALITVCLPFRLSKAKEQLWRIESFKSFAVTLWCYVRALLASSSDTAFVSRIHGLCEVSGIWHGLK